MTEPRQPAARRRRTGEPRRRAEPYALQAPKSETTLIERLETATRLNRIFLTHDENVRPLHRLYQDAGRLHGGILLVPKPRGLTEVEEEAILVPRVLLMVEWVETFTEHRGKLFEWHDLRPKLERGFRLPRLSEEQVQAALTGP